jgi:Metal-dependent amidase/aminoacylase/carboxypeptidase
LFWRKAWRLLLPESFIRLAWCDHSVTGLNDAVEPVMGSEDFAFMLEARPGNMMQIGNGGGAGLHEATFDFNDQAIPFGIAYFRKLVEGRMPL